MKAILQFIKTRWKNGALALAFGGLTAALEIAVGRHVFDPACIVCSVIASYILADKRVWLTDAGGSTPRLTRHYGIPALYALMVVLYVVATGDRVMPLMPALYLPIVLSALCYRSRIGFGVSAIVAVLYAWEVIQHGTGLGWADVCAVLSFPAVVVFVRLLSQQMENRFRVLSDRTSELSALLDMSQMMDSAADLDTTLNLILLNVQRLSACQVCAVYLKNAEGEILDLRAASGPRHRLVLAPTLLVSDARGGHWSIEESAQPEGGVAAFYIADAQADQARLNASPLFELDRRAGSFAVVPLSSVEGLVGLLYVGYDAPNGLGRDDVHRLENLSIRAAFSLQRAVMQQGFRSLAYSDAMTGLDNFRQFEQSLGDELRRAQRYERDLSVILLDIDHFKKFNDTLGHQAGDALLAQLAAVLRDSLRSVDKPARYGGEEFVVICPETGKDEARLIAERIRHNVETTAFTLLNGGDAENNSTTHVTVSVGFATFPYDALAGRGLVKGADDALYAAKHGGRNTVRSYDDLRPASVAA